MYRIHYPKNIFGVPRFWISGGGNLGFTQEKNQFTHPTWVKILGLPIEMWSGAILKNIGDNIVKFIFEGFHSKIDKRVVKILLEMDFR